MCAKDLRYRNDDVSKNCEYARTKVISILIARYKVGDWVVDPQDSSIKNQDTTFYLEPKAMSLLLLLIEADGKLVHRDTIMKVIWQGRYSGDYALNNLISTLRKYLNGTGKNEAYIKTRPKLGYQLVVSCQKIYAEQEQTSPISNLPNNAYSSDGPSNKSPFKSLLLVSFGLFIILSILFVYYFPEQESLKKEHSVAVLPFDVFDQQESLGFFADGLAEEIIHQLNGILDFRVISRRSSFFFRDKQINIKEIARRLDVDYVVEGAVRQENEMLRITLQLINTADESLLWSQVFTANEENVFAVQNEISHQIASTIDAEFEEMPTIQAQNSEISGEAYMHVLRGRKLNRSNNAESILKSRDEFLVATLLAPNYAQAHVDLAISYLLLQQNKLLSDKEAQTLFLNAIDRAFELSPELASAHAAMGIHYYNNRDTENAKASFERALAADPKLYVALVNYANLLRSNYDREEALALYERAYELAPLSAAINWGIGSTLRALGRFDDAKASYERCVSRSPESTNCLLGLAFTYRLLHLNDAADSSMVKVADMLRPEDYYFKEALAFHAFWKGDLTTANAIYNEHIEKYGVNVSLQNPTYIHVALNKEQQWLERLKPPEDPENSGLSFLASYAHSAYFNNACETAIEYYNYMLSTQPKLIDDRQVIATGVSYAANLSYCYKQTNNEEFAQDMLLKLSEILAKYPENDNVIPGLLYVKAQHAALHGNEKRVIEIAKQLKDMQWGLNWLFEKDPILKSITAGVIL